MNNLAQIFKTNVKIYNTDCMDEDFNWSHGINLAICRFPIRKKDSFSIEMLKKFCQKLKANMAPNGNVFLIMYCPVEEKSRPFEVAREMVDSGFTHVDNIIIAKTWNPGKRSEMNLVNSYDMMFHFCNGKVWRLDRKPVLDYLQIDEEEHGCPGNLWKITTGGLDDSYPADLAELVIKMCDLLPGSLICDPYMGTSSALTTALKLGHSFIGFEPDARKFKKCQDIVDNKVRPKKDKKRDVEEENEIL